MNVRFWWERMRSARRKRLLARRVRARLVIGPRLVPRPESSPTVGDPIQARVDLVRFAAFAEAAAETMEVGCAGTLRDRYEEACGFFARAIDAAERAGLAQEIVRLKARRAGLRRTFEARRKTEIRDQKSEIRNRKPDSDF
jgi:hypothetical protein